MVRALLKDVSEVMRVNNARCFRETLVQLAHGEGPHGRLDLLIANCDDSTDRPEIIIRVMDPSKPRSFEKAVDHVTIEAKRIIYENLEG